MKIVKIVNLEKIAEQMCDKYCKYPEIVVGEEGLEKVCKGCPINMAIDNRLQKFDLDSEFTMGDLACRINELIDAVNELKGGAK